MSRMVKVDQSKWLLGGGHPLIRSMVARSGVPTVMDLNLERPVTQDEGSELANRRQRRAL